MNKKILLTIIISVLILTGTAFAYFQFFVKETPKYMYFNAEKENFLSAKEEIEKEYSDEISLLKNLKEKSYKQDSRLSFSFDTSEQIQEVEEIQNLVENISLRSETLNDIKGEKIQSTLFFDYKEVEILNLLVYLSNEQIALGSKDFYSKYFVVDNENLGDLMRQYDPYYAGPDKIEFNFNQNEFLQVDEKELKAILDLYGIFIYDHISEDSVVLEEVKGENGEKLNKLTLKLSEQEVENLIDIILEKAANDEVLLDMLSSNVVNYFQYLQYQMQQVNNFSDGYNEFEDLTNKEKIKEHIRNGIEDLRIEIKNISFVEGVNSTIYLNEENKIVERDFNFSLSGEDFNGKINVQFLNKINKTDGYLQFTLKSFLEGEEQAKFNFRNNYSIIQDNNIKERNNNFSIVFGNQYSDTDTTFNFEIKEKKTKLEDDKIKKEWLMHFPIEKEVFYGYLEEDLIIDISFDNIYSYEKDKEWDSESIIKLRGESGRYFGEFSIKTNENYNFSDELNFVSFTEENSVDIAELTEFDLNNILMEVSSNAQSLLLKEEVSDLMVDVEPIVGTWLGNSMYSNSYENSSYMYEEMEEYDFENELDWEEDNNWEEDDFSWLEELEEETP